MHNMIQYSHKMDSELSGSFDSVMILLTNCPVWCVTYVGSVLTTG